MAVVLNILIALLFAIIVFNFGAYNVLLKLIARFKKVDHVTDTDLTPNVTILIAAYNEADVLREKLTNTLSLEYPTDCLEILLVSDGSTDHTDQIVKDFEDKGVQFIANPINQGKATALNIGMDKITSDIVILSDANVMYEKDVVHKLVRHFADDSIGAVSGKVVLLNEGLSYSDAENAYYSVEHNIQQLESDTGNLIGADGAMYALRRKLFRPLAPDTLLDDFVLSMGVIQQGHRLIFDAQALGYEKNLAEIASEYNRKVRIVAGGMQSLQRKTSWPPRRQTLTKLKFICHKIMRWIMGPVIVLFCALLLLRSFISNNFIIILCSITVVVGIVLFPVLTKLFPSLLNFRIFSLFHYLLMMIKASIVGCYKGLVSGQQVRWR